MRTYWFIKLVLPTPLSPRMMTCEGSLGGVATWSCAMCPTFNSIFFLDDMMTVAEGRGEEEGRVREVEARRQEERGVRSSQAGQSDSGRYQGVCAGVVEWRGGGEECLAMIV